MAISVFDIFSIGIGPSSSHTVGPMHAANQFLKHLQDSTAVSVEVELFGSLGQTGKGHGSDKAVILGLMGYRPDNVDPDEVPQILDQVRQQGSIVMGNGRKIQFQPDSDIVFHRRQSLPKHPNGMKFHGLNAQGERILSKTYYSVGGGFVVNDEHDPEAPIVEDSTQLPHPFSTGNQLLEICKETGRSISDIMLRNEQAWRSEQDVRQGLLNIWNAMDACIARGVTQEGILPGGLKVPRRAKAIYEKLKAEGQQPDDPLRTMDWVDLYALAVNEENAAGGRVVTAPTNGAAGIIPAVLKYYLTFSCPDWQHEEAVVRFLLTAAAIGILYKLNASISGAEVGCQGEVGVACSMAAGALTEVLGGTPMQVENAAEIGMEHNLGLTCDPVGGLVQVPCIERNAMASVKAINAARLALRGDGQHKVSLDKVIKTMKETGRDMKSKYKETARGGLAVNIIEC
jgi:L-serine dehydratase